MKYLLGIDNGGTVTKAGIYDTTGQAVAISQRTLDMIIPHEGMCERDAGEIEAANTAVIRDVIERAGISGQDIISISVTGQGNGAYIFDENGAPVRNPILSGDIRANEYVKRWYADGLVEKIFLPKACQVVWAGQPIALLAWLRDNEPDVLARARHLVTSKDYTRYLLTGRFCSELTESSGWGCMDVRKGAFDPEIFEAAGLSEYFGLMEDVIASTDVGGYITESAAAKTGLCAGTPVTGGMFDITACAIGTGVVDSGKLCIVIGSWSINEYIDTSPVQAIDLFQSSRYVLPGYYLMLEGSATSAANLDWFVKRLMDREAKEPGNVYEKINEMVMSVDTRDCPVLFVPFLYGSNANIDARSLFIGLRGIHTKAHMLRAVYEGIVFCHRYHIEKLFRYRKDFNAVRISGGGTKSDVWLQMFADIIGLPMEITEAQETGTLGAAMCAGVGVGQYPGMVQAADKFVKLKKTVCPNAESSRFYEKKYQLYKKVLDSLDGVWEDFNAISRG